jgi:hypothetical protein
MATYYWLGKQASTGTGNVNNPLNWTPISPAGSCGSIPPSSPIIPGNGDTIFFTRFVAGSCVYPLHSPGGTLGTGVSGSTAIISNMYLVSDCPVPLGICGQSGYADELFRVNVKTICELITTDNTPVVTGAHYIEFKDNKIGATPAQYDPRVNMKSFSFPEKTFRLSGVIGNFFVGDNSLSFPSNANIYLRDITLSGSSVLEPTFNKAFNVLNASRENIFIRETAKINSASLRGTSRTYVSPGFGSTGSFRVVGTNSTTNYSMIEFVPAGICGFSYGTPLITQLNTLEIYGGLANVYHGIGISYLDHNGGTLYLNVPPGSTGKMCSIYEGVFYANTASKLISEYATITLGEGSLGSGGSFIIKNQAGPGFGVIPQITLKGRYDLEVNPESETS